MEEEVFNNIENLIDMMSGVLSLCRISGFIQDIQGGALPKACMDAILSSVQALNSMCSDDVLVQLATFYELKAGFDDPYNFDRRPIKRDIAELTELNLFWNVELHSLMAKPTISELTETLLGHLSRAGRAHPCFLDCAEQVKDTMASICECIEDATHNFSPYVIRRGKLTFV